MIRKGDMKRRLDQGLRGLERRHRPRLRPARPCADRQGHVGDARPMAGDAGAEDRPPEGRRQHRLGALAHRRDAARDALPPGRRRRAAGAELEGRARAPARRHPDDPARRPAQLGAGRDPGRTRQQRAGHPRLCGALGRPGRRLLQGARHQRRRPDGGPRDAAHLQPAHRQLAAPRRRQPRPGDGDAEAHGEVVDRRTPATRLPPDGAGLRRSIAFQAACDLVFKGREQPNGYTEPILHARSGGSRFAVRWCWRILATDLP
jgi:hypothetical protein